MIICVIAHSGHFLGQKRQGCLQYYLELLKAEGFGAHENHFLSPFVSYELRITSPQAPAERCLAGGFCATKTHLQIEIPEPFFAPGAALFIVIVFVRNPNRCSIIERTKMQTQFSGLD